MVEPAFSLRSWDDLIQAEFMDTRQQHSLRIGSRRLERRANLISLLYDWPTSNNCLNQRTTNHPSHTSSDSGSKERRGARPLLAQQPTKLSTAKGRSLCTRLPTARTISYSPTSSFLTHSQPKHNLLRERSHATAGQVLSLKIRRRESESACRLTLAVRAGHVQRSIPPVLNKATYRVAECSPDLGDGPGHLVCGVMDDLCISNLLFDGRRFCAAAVVTFTPAFGNRRLCPNTDMLNILRPAQGCTRPAHTSRR